MGLLLENCTQDTIAIIVSILACIVAFYKWKLSYWERRGLETVKSSIPFGSVGDMFKKKKSFGEQFESIYNELKAKGVKHGGAYFWMNPVYVPLDHELVKLIMQRDFQHFMNHGFYVNEVHDPLTGNLFSLEDEKWRKLRIKLTPTFTSGKMKMMFGILVECTAVLTEVLNQYAVKNETLEIKDVFARFTTDIISSVAFGLECNSLQEPDNEFRRQGKRIFEDTFRDMFKGLLQFVLPRSVLDLCRFKVTKQENEDFFLGIVNKTVEYREKNNITRNDFLHLLIQLKNGKKIDDDTKITDNETDNKSEGMTINEVAAQCFVFFIAGFETSSTASTFLLYELAKNQDLQQKVREEINTVLKKYDGKITYEAMAEMTYMEQVIYESLRKYPPLSALPRVCTKDYKVPGTNTIIEKNTPVMISVGGLHHDPEYYPNPEVFDPDRFTEENKSKRPPFTWLPFGEGPRLCIGLRFGMIQSKVGLTAILKNFKVKLNEKTKEPLVMEKTAFITSPDGGIWLNLEKIV